MGPVAATGDSALLLATKGGWTQHGGEAHSPLELVPWRGIGEHEGRRVSPPAASLVTVLVFWGMRSLPEGFAVTLRCGVGADPLTDISQMLKVFTDGYIPHGDGDKVL